MMTQTSRYALRALIHLAASDAEGYRQTRDIAGKISVPANYLGKTMQKLAHARVLDSQKGLHGGFRLSRPADKITLYQILVAIEAVPRDTIDDSEANTGLPSKVYATFAELSRLYNDFLRKTTLADLMPEDWAIEGKKAPTEQVPAS